MFRINRRGIFIFTVLLLNAASSAFGAADTPLDLERIVITKSNIHLTNPYSLDFDSSDPRVFSSPVEALAGLPIDLQGRSPKGGIQTDFSLRGSSFQGVLVLIDGQRINDPQTAHHNQDIPLTGEDIDKIEVIPGVSSSIFGPDALGGAINIITKKPQENKGALELGFGEHQTGSGDFSITRKINNLGMRLSVEDRQSDGFRFDTDFKKFTSSFASSLNIPDGEVNLDFGYQQKEFGAFDFYTPGKNFPSREWTRTFLLNTGMILEKSVTIKPNFLWRRHFDKFMLDETGLISKYLNHHRTDCFTPNIYFQKETDNIGTLGLGLEYGLEDINSTNLGEHKRGHKSVFLDESKDLNSKLCLGASARFDDFDGFGPVYTGSANLRYRLFKNKELHFGINRSMRIPSFTELFYSDPTTVGDPNLSAEKSFGYEAGYDYKTRDFSWGATFFIRQEKDTIDWVKDNPAQEKWAVRNINASDVYGIENNLKLHVASYLDINANYTYIDKYSYKSYIYKYGPSFSRHLVNSSFNFPLPFGMQSLEFTYKKKPDRRGWLIVNTCFSYNLSRPGDPRSVGPRSKIFLRISNLFNVEYQDIEGIPQPGRWAQAGIRFDW